MKDYLVNKVLDYQEIIWKAFLSGSVISNNEVNVGRAVLGENLFWFLTVLQQWKL